MNVSPKLLALLVATNVAMLSALAFLVLTGFAHPRPEAQETAHFKELTAERIDIVSPAGKTVIAICNKERIAGPVMGGTSYPVAASEGRELMAGMIFFNQDGDEMGGLVFNSFRRPDGKAAGIGHLSFDRFQDNQVLALQYKENATTVQAGLTLYDRPANGAFKTCLDLAEEARAAAPERRAEIQAKLDELTRDHGLGVERVFLGSKDRTAQLQLKDSQGRVRARLVIDTRDEARLEFLDEAGQVIARFPE
jgi:hypothetical protein